MTVSTYARQNPVVVMIVVLAALYLLVRITQSEGYASPARRRIRRQPMLPNPTARVLGNGTLVINGVHYRPGHSHYNHYRTLHAHLFPPPPDYMQTYQQACQKAACNAVIRDWIVKRRTSFNDSASAFSQCAGCPSRWSKGRDVSHDGANWQRFATRTAAYQAARVDAAPIHPWNPYPYVPPVTVPQMPNITPQMPYVSQQLANAEELIKWANRLQKLA